MTTHLSDNREFESATVAEGDAKFDRLAALEIAIKARAARAEKRVADIKTKLEADNADAIEEYNELAEWLNSYITTNKERFKKPKMRKTTFGKYGLGKGTKLTVKSEDDVIAHADQKGLILYTTKKKIDKKAIKKAISDGEKIPGCKLISGDIAKFAVDKILLNAEIKKG